MSANDDRKMPEGYATYCAEWEARIGAFLEFDPGRAEAGEGDAAAGGVPAAGDGPLAGFLTAISRFATGVYPVEGLAERQGIIDDGDAALADSRRIGFRVPKDF